MKAALKILGAVLLGLYLGALPFLAAMFPTHRSDCPCHAPARLIELRWKSLTGR